MFNDISTKIEDQTNISFANADISMSKKRLKVHKYSAKECGIHE